MTVGFMKLSICYHRCICSRIIGCEDQKGLQVTALSKTLLPGQPFMFWGCRQEAGEKSMIL